MNRRLPKNVTPEAVRELAAILQLPCEEGEVPLFYRDEDRDWVIQTRANSVYLTGGHMDLEAPGMKAARTGLEALQLSTAHLRVFCARWPKL